MRRLGLIIGKLGGDFGLAVSDRKWKDLRREKSVLFGRRKA